MNYRSLYLAGLCLGVLIAMPVSADPQTGNRFEWQTVVNNNDLIPPLLVRNFNSYNQPSVNVDGVVVMRARSRGGPPLGPATHGIYVRDMSLPDSDLVRILDRTTQVPQPNNLDATFTETPSFPRIDMRSPAIATRGNHPPVHRYELADGSETRAGTTGIYTNPFGDLVTGEANFGNAPGQTRFGVPEFSDQRFEVFPGAPAITATDTIVFKGNYTIDGQSKTGVYFRKLVPGEGGGASPAILIANNTDSIIPGTATIFGSTAPPNAADGHAVFAGFDNEDAPTRGGIYMAPLEFQPALSALVSIGDRVPGSPGKATFTDFGEALSFDGRYVAFWGAWGDGSRNVRLHCPLEGNKDRIAYCNQALACEATGEVLGDPNSVCDDPTDPFFGQRCYAEQSVPANQGIFIHDTLSGETRLVARNIGQFDDFLFWNYSGKPPCSSESHGDDSDASDAHSIKWRSSAFVAVGHSRPRQFKVAFKARRGDVVGGQYVDPVDGIYLAKGQGQADAVTVLDTTMDGQALDPEAPAGSTILELGLEREGLRGDWLAITATMGIVGSDEEDDSLAGVYVSRP